MTSGYKIMDNDELWFKLKQPFPKGAIHWRLGATNQKKIARETDDKYAKPTKGIPLCYVDARMVMQRLDDVVGPGGWQDSFIETPKRIICRIGIKVDDEWIWKGDGAGDTDMEGEKGGLSDSFKRAAVKFGVGRYLYGIKIGWIDLNDRGQIPHTWNGREFLPEPSFFSSKQMRTKYYKGLKEAAGDDDSGKARELWDEMNQEQQTEIWGELSSGVRSTIKGLLESTGVHSE